MGDVGLPLRRPSQHPIEDFFHLFFCHSAIIADQLPMTNAADHLELAT
jgi:hypothetical protein